MSTEGHAKKTAGTAASGPRKLSMQPLGLSGPAEAVYRILLRHPGMGIAALGNLVTGSEETLGELLDLLQRRGLVSRAKGPALGWVAAAPEVAVELLLMERQAELNEARRILPELRKELVRSVADVGAEEVQILPDPESQLQAYLQLHDRARTSIATLIRPPFLVSAPSAIQAARDAARKRGVRFRTLLAPEMMKWDGWLASATQAAALGDEMRSLDGLPFKMLLVDGDCAMVPLRTDEPEGPALRLGNTAAVQALSMMFERLWGDAVPLVAPPDAEADAASDGDAALQELATLLATGANDKTAAHVLGISDRTLQRRTAALSDRLRARSRFQCGWLAARRFGR